MRTYIGRILCPRCLVELDVVASSSLTIMVCPTDWCFYESNGYDEVGRFFPASGHFYPSEEMCNVI